MFIIYIFKNYIDISVYFHNINYKIQSISNIHVYNMYD